MGRSPSCCSGMDYVEIDTESRSRKARTLDMNGYSNRLELEYDELISRYSPDDGSLIIEIKIESSNKKWLKHYKAPCFEEDFEEIQIKLSEASDNDSINVYLYENNPSLHAAVGHSEILDSYPLLIDVNKEFQLLLSQKVANQNYSIDVLVCVSGAILSNISKNHFRTKLNSFFRHLQPDYSNNRGSSNTE